MHAVLPSDRPLQTAARMALVALFLSVVGAAICWQERALYLDAAHIFFRIVNEQSLQIQEGRIGSFITQGTVLAGSQAGLSLPILLALYSLSFALFYFLSGWVLYRLCRRYDLVILLGAYHVLLCTSGWYWTNNEIHQGVTWLLLSWGVTQKLARRYTVPAFLLFAGGTYLALFTHPLVMIPAVALWGLWVINGHLPWSARGFNIAATVTLVAVSIWKFSASAGSGGYETGKMAYVQNMKPIEVFRTFTGPVSTAFYRGLIVSYPGFLVLFILGLWVAFKDKKYVLIAWCMAMIVGHLVLLGLTYHSFEAWYMESEWMGFAIPGVGLLLYTRRLRGTKVNSILMLGSAILLVQTVLIAVAGAPFQRRIALSREVLEKMRQAGVHKAIVPEKMLRASAGDLMVWDAPVQSQLLSALRGDRPNYTFTGASSPADAAFKARLSKDSAWEAFGARPASEYNPRYMSIDTAGVYRELPGLQ